MKKTTTAHGGTGTPMTMTFPSVLDLCDFRYMTSGLTQDDQKSIINQALFLFDFLYVHLVLKQSMHAVDPIQRLKLLAVNLGRLKGEYEFHNAMLEIFTSVRDLHTNYILPEPFTSWVAILPFSVEEYFDERGMPHYPVKNVWRDLNAPPFEVGVEVTHWNGIPMHVAVDQNAHLHGGSNRAARHLQGLRNMTVRPLAMAPMPAEDWVTLTYVRRGGGVSETRFPWKVVPSRPPPHAVDANDKGSAAARSLGLDLQQQQVHEARKWLFAPRVVEHQAKADAILSSGGTLTGTSVSENTEENLSSFSELSYRKVKTPSGTFGYLGIWSFNINDVTGFVNEVIRILGLLPQDGLILDIRSNPGGNILAGESLLQLFTDKVIAPEPLSLRNTIQTMAYARNDFLERYRSSIELSISTGEQFSQAFPLLTQEQVNQVGRKYFGKVVLLTDAACYSTADIFAAGFQDHEIGPVLGQDETTGAGGANVWTHSLLSQFWPLPNNPLQPFPKGMDMRIAFRRSLRVGSRLGLPLEDLGVTSDVIHLRTRRDLFQTDEDLLAKAGALLAEMNRRG